MKNKRSIKKPDCCGFCKHYVYIDIESCSYCSLVDEEDDSRYDANFFDICDDYKRAE